MLSITHVAIGTGIARLIPYPPLSIPLALAAHYVGDWVPHWDCGTGINDGSKSKLRAVGDELVDLALTGLFVLFLFELPQPGIQWHYWIVAFVSLLPDFIEAPANFLQLDIKVLTPLNAFHDKFHGSTKDMIVGLLPQLLIIWLVYMIS